MIFKAKMAQVNKWRNKICVDTDETQVSVRGMLGLGEGKQNSLRIMPKYGKELRQKKRNELRQRKRQKEGRKSR